jgi:matrix metalloproteinase-19 (RASI)
VTTKTGGTNLRAVALHEIGHAIGIKHSQAAQSVMRDVILNNNTELYPDDIAAIRWMYGNICNSY